MENTKHFSFALTIATNISKQNIKLYVLKYIKMVVSAYCSECSWSKLIFKSQEKVHACTQTQANKQNQLKWGMNAVDLHSTVHSGSYPLCLRRNK